MRVSVCECVSESVRVCVCLKESGTTLGECVKWMREREKCAEVKNEHSFNFCRRCNITSSPFSNKSNGVPQS